MRQKDAETVATILGIELRTCTHSEEHGLRTALAAVEGHMRHVHPEFDAEAYWRRAADACDMGDSEGYLDFVRQVDYQPRDI